MGLDCWTDSFSLRSESIYSLTCSRLYSYACCWPMTWKGVLTYLLQEWWYQCESHSAPPQVSTSCPWHVPLVSSPSAWTAESVFTVKLIGPSFNWHCILKTTVHAAQLILGVLAAKSLGSWNDAWIKHWHRAIPTTRTLQTCFEEVYTMYTCMVNLSVTWSTTAELYPAYSKYDSPGSSMSHRVAWKHKISRFNPKG